MTAGMVKDTSVMMPVYPHISLFPCAAITVPVIGFNLLADRMQGISPRD